MAKKGQEPPATVRLQAILDIDTAAGMDEARAALKRAGIHVSSSMFVEIALRELLANKDERILAIMAHHKRSIGSLARRKSDDSS